MANTKKPFPGKLFSSKNFLVINMALVSMIVGFVLATVLNFGCTDSKGQEGVAGGGVSRAFAQDSSELSEGLKTLENIQYSFRQVAQRALPVVVEINVVEVISQNRPQFNSPWEFFFNPSPFDRSPQEREYRRPGLGSGVIVQNGGGKVYVVTNNHVIGGAEEISVRLNDGREYEAKIVGKDTRTDLALVVFETREEIPVAVLGDSERLQVGDWALAVGNPFGFESTVTAGIVSALGRQAGTGMQVASFTEYIQTDAAINPGNSGGALLNIRGEVIGINTWIASQSGGSVGLGFAIPINNVKKAINDFITKGKVVYGWLGVQIIDAVAEQYPAYVDNMGVKDHGGALVLNLFRGAPAEKGGLQPGDVIIKVGNTEIGSSGELTKVIGNLPPGRQMAFTFIRYGEEKRVDVKLVAREDEQSVQSNTNLWPGMVAVPLADAVRAQLDLPRNLQGVVIGSVVEGSPSSFAGLRQGDVVTEIGDKQIRGMMDFYRGLSSGDKREILFHVQREGKEQTLGLVR
jgi:serine protease Do